MTEHVKEMKKLGFGEEELAEYMSECYLLQEDLASSPVPKMEGDNALMIFTPQHKSDGTANYYTATTKSKTTEATQVYNTAEDNTNGAGEVDLFSKLLDGELPVPLP